ncbi:MAG: tRNA (adenosine(37)-N6)-dimethylallyltransferase MiaA [Ignavibacteria bacterium]|jgi:tRNA dimethylallyltransferase|nr:tRNA (adenosine(37)-N6)-dimethylallyltransferase MiaA [Ignavibacteria bacterium]
MIDTIVVCGATASGKTAYSLQLAEKQDIEIISADSRQVYKFLTIGTAKPSASEMQKVKHHYIDILMPDANYSAGEYGEQAYATLIDIAERGKTPVIVGGSGLYIKSLCEGLFKEDTPVDVGIRNKLEMELQANGIDTLYNKLKEVDAPLYNLYSDRNPRRVLRALEYYYSNGIRLSDAYANKPSRDRIKPRYVFIDVARDVLYDKINRRVMQMWEDGLVDETESVLNMGYSPTLNSLNTVGYKETIVYLNGDMSLDTAISEIQKNTRHYAKRQLTWLRKFILEEKLSEL